MDKKCPSNRIRILIARGIERSEVVLATDSALVMYECETISDRPDDLGIETPLGGSGLILWEGTAKSWCDSNEESETEYTGTAVPCWRANWTDCWQWSQQIPNSTKTRRTRERRFRNPRGHQVTSRSLRPF